MSSIPPRLPVSLLILLLTILQLPPTLSQQIIQLGGNSKIPTSRDPIVPPQLFPIIPKTDRNEPTFLIGYLHEDNYSLQDVPQMLKIQGYGVDPQVVPITVKNKHYVCILPQHRYPYLRYDQSLTSSDSLIQNLYQITRVNNDGGNTPDNGAVTPANTPKTDQSDQSDQSDQLSQFDQNNRKKQQNWTDSPEFRQLVAEMTANTDHQSVPNYNWYIHAPQIDLSPTESFFNTKSQTPTTPTIPLSTTLTPNAMTTPSRRVTATPQYRPLPRLQPSVENVLFSSKTTNLETNQLSTFERSPQSTLSSISSASNRSNWFANPLDIDVALIGAFPLRQTTLSQKSPKQLQQQQQLTPSGNPFLPSALYLPHFPFPQKTDEEKETCIDGKVVRTGQVGYGTPAEFIISICPSKTITTQTGPVSTSHSFEPLSNNDTDISRFGLGSKSQSSKAAEKNSKKQSQHNTSSFSPIPSMPLLPTLFESPSSLRMASSQPNFVPAITLGHFELAQVNFKIAPDKSFISTTSTITFRQMLTSVASTYVEQANLEMGTQAKDNKSGQPNSNSNSETKASSDKKLQPSSITIGQYVDFTNSQYQQFTTNANATNLTKIGVLFHNTYNLYSIHSHKTSPSQSSHTQYFLQRVATDLSPLSPVHSRKFNTNYDPTSSLPINPSLDALSSRTPFHKEIFDQITQMFFQPTDFTTFLLDIKHNQPPPNDHIIPSFHFITQLLQNHFFNLTTVLSLPNTPTEPTKPGAITPKVPQAVDPSQKPSPIMDPIAPTREQLSNKQIYDLVQSYTLESPITKQQLDSNPSPFAETIKSWGKNSKKDETDITVHDIFTNTQEEFGKVVETIYLKSKFATDTSATPTHQTQSSPQHKATPSAGSKNPTSRPGNNNKTNQTDPPSPFMNTTYTRNNVHPQALDLHTAFTEMLMRLTYLYLPPALQHDFLSTTLGITNKSDLQAYVLYEQLQCTYSIIPNNPLSLDFSPEGQNSSQQPPSTPIQLFHVIPSLPTCYHPDQFQSNLASSNTIPHLPLPKQFSTITTTPSTITSSSSSMSLQQAIQHHHVIHSTKNGIISDLNSIFATYPPRPVSFTSTAHRVPINSASTFASSTQKTSTSAQPRTTQTSKTDLSRSQSPPTPSTPLALVPYQPTNLPPQPLFFHPLSKRNLKLPNQFIPPPIIIPQSIHHLEASYLIDSIFGNFFATFDFYKFPHKFRTPRGSPHPNQQNKPVQLTSAPPPLSTSITTAPKRSISETIRNIVDVLDPQHSSLRISPNINTVTELPCLTFTRSHNDWWTYKVCPHMLLQYHAEKFTQGTVEDTLRPQNELVKANSFPIFDISANYQQFTLGDLFPTLKREELKESQTDWKMRANSSKGSKRDKSSASNSSNPTTGSSKNDPSGPLSGATIMNLAKHLQIHAVTRSPRASITSPLPTTSAISSDISVQQQQKQAMPPTPKAKAPITLATGGAQSTATGSASSPPTSGQNPFFPGAQRSGPPGLVNLFHPDPAPIETSAHFQGSHGLDFDATLVDPARVAEYHETQRLKHELINGSQGKDGTGGVEHKTRPTHEKYHSSVQLLPTTNDQIEYYFSYTLDHGDVCIPTSQDVHQVRKENMENKPRSTVFRFFCDHHIFSLALNNKLKQREAIAAKSKTPVSMARGVVQVTEGLISRLPKDYQPLHAFLPLNSNTGTQSETQNAQSGQTSSPQSHLPLHFGKVVNIYETTPCIYTVDITTTAVCDFSLNQPWFDDLFHDFERIQVEKSATYMDKTNISTNDANKDSKSTNPANPSNSSPAPSTLPPLSPPAVHSAFFSVMSPYVDQTGKNNIHNSLPLHDDNRWQVHEVMCVQDDNAYTPGNMKNPTKYRQDLVRSKPQFPLSQILDHVAAANSTNLSPPGQNQAERATDHHHKAVAKDFKAAQISPLDILLDQAVTGQSYKSLYIAQQVLQSQSITTPQLSSPLQSIAPPTCPIHPLATSLSEIHSSERNQANTCAVDNPEHQNPFVYHLQLRYTPLYQSPYEINQFPLFNAFPIRLTGSMDDVEHKQQRLLEQFLSFDEIIHQHVDTF